MLARGTAQESRDTRATERALPMCMHAQGSAQLAANHADDTTFQTTDNCSLLLPAFVERPNMCVGVS